jgi:hypothetical protein
MAKDMRGTHVADVLEQIFDDMAQGNEGDSEIEELVLDGTVLHYKVKIRHHHVIKIKIPLDGKKKVDVYSVTMHAQGKIDVINPDPGDSKVCVDSPVGKICRTLTEVMTIVAGLV